MSRIRRLGLGVIDQGLSSLSNMLFLVAVAREAGIDEFGAVSFAYALFAFGLAVQRSSIGTLIALSAGKLLVPPLLGSVLWGATMVAVGVGLGAVVGDGGSAAYYVVLSGCVLIYPQDLLRYSAIAERRVGLATVSDGAWMAVTLALLLASLVGATLSVTAIAAVWVFVGAGTGLVLIAVPVLRVVTGRSHWLRDHASELRTLGPDALLACTAPLMLAAAMAHYMSLGDVAAVRGAGTLLGPVTMIFSALPAVLLPEMARVFGNDRSRLATVQAVVMSALVLAWGGALLLLPDAAGEQVLGESWANSRTILIWAVLEIVIWALATGPIALLGSYRQWRTLIRVRIVYLITVGCTLGVTVPSGSLTRVMIGMAFASAVNCTILTVAARREKARYS
ncbi:MAG: hypothetical protein ABIR39_07195 [Nocardioides sp.]|uniref:hypothetical protein n=1 Tax=Nocardioides sp. TaxID=35761 RepID=UPI0032636EEE